MRYADREYQVLEPLTKAELVKAINQDDCSSLISAFCNAATIGVAAAPEPETLKESILSYFMQRGASGNNYGEIMNFLRFHHDMTHIIKDWHFTHK